MNKPKSEFSLRSYGKLVREINRDPKILEHDWREVLESAFELTAEQRENISCLSNSIVLKTQASFDAALNHVRNGGKLKTRIQTKDDGSHELNFMLENSLDKTEAQEPEAQDLRGIICCDADCGNWQVGC